MEEIKHAIQDEYDDDYAWCYGCGRKNETGLKLRTGWKEDKTITVYTPRDEHKAIPGFIYGGLIASVIDCHGTGSASLAMHRKLGQEPGDGIDAPRFVTASLHVDYIKPTPAGVPLRAIGEVEEIHPKKWKVVTELFAGDLLCAKGVVEAVVMPDTFMKK